MVLPVAHAHGTYAGAGVGGVTCAFASPSSRSTTNKNNVVTMKGNLPVALSLSAVWGKNGFFSFPISKTKSTKQQDDDEEQRETLKQALLRECCRPDSASFSREVVEAAIGALAAYTPIVETAASPVLQQPWQLVWTTEKEINFFLDRGWSTNVTQCITNNNHDNKEWNENDNNNDSDSTGTLVNAIPFVNNRGSLEVVGRLFRNINEDPVVRTRFVFETATVTLGNWISIPLPPVGQGWFDTVYLDDTFRVDMNSRNDILICRSFPP